MLVQQGDSSAAALSHCSSRPARSDPDRKRGRDRPLTVGETMGILERCAVGRDARAQPTGNAQIALAPRRFDRSGPTDDFSIDSG